MNIDDEIDKYLKKLYEHRDYKMFANQLFENSYMSNVPHTIDEILIEKNLVMATVEVRMLTELGIRISELGGWKHYLTTKNEADRKEN